MTEPLDPEALLDYLERTSADPSTGIASLRARMAMAEQERSVALRSQLTLVEGARDAADLQLRKSEAEAARLRESVEQLELVNETIRTHWTEEQLVVERLKARVAQLEDETCPRVLEVGGGGK